MGTIQEREIRPVEHNRREKTGFTPRRDVLRILCSVASFRGVCRAVKEAITVPLSHLRSKTVNGKTAEVWAAYL